MDKDKNMDDEMKLKILKQIQKEVSEMHVDIEPEDWPKLITGPNLYQNLPVRFQNLIEMKTRPRGCLWLSSACTWVIDQMCWFESISTFRCHDIDDIDDIDDEN